MELDPRWIIVMVSAGLAFGALSPVVAARRNYFLASALPHSALVAALAGVPLSYSLGLNPSLWAILLSIPLIYIIMILEKAGVDVEIATSVLVAATASLSVALIYLVLTSYPVSTSLWAYIIGDPLLATWNDTLITGVIALLVALALLPFMREHVMIGVDRDFAATSGLRLNLYDAVYYAALAIAGVGMMKTVGFVLEHVMILLPASIAVNTGRSGKEAASIALVSAVGSGITGLAVALYTPIPPSAGAGFVLLAAYLAALALRGRRA